MKLKKEQVRKGGLAACPPTLTGKQRGSTTLPDLLNSEIIFPFKMLEWKVSGKELKFSTEAIGDLQWRTGN